MIGLQLNNFIELADSFAFIILLLVYFADAKHCIYRFVINIKRMFKVF